MISGYVNNDKKLIFDVVVDYPETDIQGGFGYSNELSKYEVFPNENK